MEKYTFLKFIKIKEKENKKKIKYFKSQIGGNQTIDFKSIQLKLFNLEQELQSINQRSTNTIINPYNILKNQIDEINKSINQLQKKNTLINDNDEILNKITELKIILDSSPNDYTKIQANTKVSYVSEAISTDQIAIIFEKYIDDSNLMIDDIKKKIGISNGKLIKNKEILSIIKQIRSKINEYNKNLDNFKNLEMELNKNIDEMIKLFNVEIDANTTYEDYNEADKIITVDKISIEDEEDEEDELELDEVLKIASTKEEISELIGIHFLDENPSLQENSSSELPKATINQNMTNLYQEWSNKVTNYKGKLEENVADNSNKSQHKSSYDASFYNKYLLNGGTIPKPSSSKLETKPTKTESDKTESDKSEANILELIEELKNYEKLVRDSKIYIIKLIKLVKFYNIRYSQFFNFQKYIVNYVSLTIAEGGYTYWQYMNFESILGFNKILSELGNKLDNFNNYSKLNSVDREFLKKPHIKWFYGKHYFIIKILQNFFYKLYEKFKGANMTENKAIKTDKFNSNYFFLFNIFQQILLKYIYISELSYEEYKE
jgi:hypothetical protein